MSTDTVDLSQLVINAVAPRAILIELSTIGLHARATETARHDFSRPRMLGELGAMAIHALVRTIGLKWSVRQQWDEWAQCSEGTYILRTNITD